MNDSNPYCTNEAGLRLAQHWAKKKEGDGFHRFMRLRRKYWLWPVFLILHRVGLWLKETP
jgi:hypothetical protein